jgi:hypothetical protein
MSASSPSQPAPAAVLIVNGGADCVGGRWLELCLRQLRRYTAAGAYRLYVWNNNTGDSVIGELVRGEPDAVFMQCPPGLGLSHVHADPLQRLYETARDDGAHYIVTLDSDAFPIAPGWLEELTRAVDQGSVMAGIWRDELQPFIRPYVHPSCLCTTVAFLESAGLRLDYIDSDQPSGPEDTLSCLTRYAETAGLRCHKLRRSNQRQVHRLMGGVYGELVYHHGAGSRGTDGLVSFRGDPMDIALYARNARIGDALGHLLFQKTDAYLDWLRGAPSSDPELDRQLEALAAGDLSPFSQLRSRATSLPPVQGIPIPGLRRVTRLARTWWRDQRQKAARS